MPIHVSIHVSTRCELKTTLILFCRFQLSELQRLTLDPVLCSKWEDIGISLGLADEDDGAGLEGLKAKHGDDKKRMMEVFKIWLRDFKNKIPPTCDWRHLLEALSNNDLQSVVGKIQSSFGKETHYHVSYTFTHFVNYSN